MRNAGNNSVVVTRVDQRHIHLAKQLFAGVHFNAGWTNDLLLLAHNIPESSLSWFYKRNILVHKCKPLYRVGDWPAYAASKLYLFTKDMKRWNKIIYLDPDIIVRASLQYLTEVEEFSAVPELDRQPLFDQLCINNINDWVIYKNIEKNQRNKINLTSLSFNAGVLAFDTKIIQKNTFKEIENILWSTKKISKYADQTALNLYFYDKWRKLPIVYNLMPGVYIKYGFKYETMDAICFHCTGDHPTDKPDNQKNFFFNEWNENFTKAELINRKMIPKPQKVWSKNKIQLYDYYLLAQRFIHAPFKNQIKNSKIRSICLQLSEENITT